MSFFVPARLRESASAWGEAGTRWLENLPARVAELEQAWSLTAGRPFDADTNAWVAPVRLADGSEAMLKIGLPDIETLHEAAGLRVFDGRGAVRLLRATDDGYALLLERCVPGTNLWSVGEQEGEAVGAEILRLLWREPPPGAPFAGLSDFAREWSELLPRIGPSAGYDSALIARAVEMAGQLAATQRQRVILHGDFHPGNVLSAARRPWLAIDPKPLVGDPAYDLAQWLGNRCASAEQTSDPVTAIRRQIDRFSELLCLDPDRVAGWAFVKSIAWGWGAWSARVLHEALGR
jgi:streptomycin 6-kinase